ncbi:hypothetical protein ACFS4T_32665 [Pseudomonas lini]
MAKKTTHIDRERERLWLEDGDFLDLDWHGPPTARLRRWCWCCTA